MNFSFSGSAWYSAYHVGVASYLKQAGLVTVSKGSAVPTMLSGTSGGAVVAAALMCGLDLGVNGEPMRYFRA